MNCCATPDTDSPRTAIQGVPFVPLPMVIVAFVIGMMFGVILGRKRETMMHGGMHGMHGMHGMKPWMAYGVKPHHHHGEGSPACQEEHTDWPQVAPEHDAPHADPET